MIQRLRRTSFAALAALALLAGCSPGSGSLPPPGPAAAKTAPSSAQQLSMIFTSGGVSRTLPMRTTPRQPSGTRSTKFDRISTPIDGGGGGCGNFCGDDGFCPDCSWNPEIAAHKPDDFTLDNDPGTSCTSFDLSFDSDLTVCFSNPLKKFFHFSHFAYGQCNTGTYDYINGAYQLRCVAPPGDPEDGFWFLHVTFTSLTGSSQPLGRTTANPSESFLISVPSTQSAFTNMNVCFNQHVDPGYPCDFSGGGISVGLR